MLKMETDAQNASMEEDVRKMFRDASFHDMLFICGQQQEQVPACRFLMAARSPFLKTLLAPGKHPVSRIALPEIEPTTMRICLEFFYTDTVEESSWLSCESTMKVIGAAKLFHVPKLEQLAVSRFSSSNANIVERDSDVDLICAYTHGVKILRAHKCAEDKCADLDALLWTLIERIGFNYNDWKLVRHKHLSEESLFHLVQSVGKPTHGFEQESNVYDCFHLVIQWCASQLVLESDNPHEEGQLVKATIDKFLPWLFCDVCEHIFLVQKGFEMQSADEKDWRIIKLLGRKFAKTRKRFSLKFSRIPASILCSIIEPIDIVSQTKLMSAYRYQALSKPDFMRWDEFGHGDNYAIAKDDFTILSCESDEFRGFARCNMGVNVHSVMTLHWKMTILKPCERLRVGFYRSKPHLARGGHDDAHVLGDHEGSCALSLDGFLHLNLGEHVAPMCYLEDVTENQSEGLNVDVHLDTESFSLSINNKWGKPLEISWSPDEVIYPAISMQKPGRVKVEMVISKSLTKPKKVVLKDDDRKRFRSH